MERWWKFKIIISLFTLMNISSSLGSRHTKRVGYGGSCNSTVKCDIHSLLTCEENTCVCLYQDAMSYSSELGTCLSLVNEVCGYLETKRVFINCISNANCDVGQGVCKCTQGFIELERICVQQKSYGETCHSNSECKPDLSLTCFEEICQCDPEKHVPILIGLEGQGTDEVQSVLDDKKKAEMKCVTRAGLPCTVKTGCVPKATCVSSGIEDGIESFSRLYNWNHSGHCVCDSGYEMDKNGFCRGKFGSYCDVVANITCLEKFRCLNGICDCKYPDDQVYHEDTEQCVSLLSGPCTDLGKNETINSTTILCDRFLTCKDELCECKTGFVENKDRGCDLSYGQPCTGETMIKCDKAGGLHCVEGKCTCRDDRKDYDASVGKCLGKAGASCQVMNKEDKDYIIPTNSIESKAYRKAHRGKLKAKANSECVQGAVCQFSREQLRGLSTRGTCKDLVSNKEASISSNSGNSNEYGD